MISNTIMAIARAVWKYTVCLLFHRRHRCYPVVWGEEQAKAFGIPYEPNRWHCRACHPCNEGLKAAMAALEAEDTQSTQR